MPIIIDTNCFANVFSKNSAKHEEFAPVLEWVKSGSGKFVYGGTKYMKEIPAKYLRILRYFNELNKTIKGDTSEIDEIELKNIELINDNDFDDPHIAAIVSVTKCRLICSEDTRSVKFIKNKILYPKHISVPKYYTGLKNKKLLVDKNIDKIHKPVLKLSKKQKSKLERNINKY